MKHHLNHVIEEDCFRIELLLRMLGDPELACQDPGPYPGEDCAGITVNHPGRGPASSQHRPAVVVEVAPDDQSQDL